MGTCLFSCVIQSVFNGKEAFNDDVKNPGPKKVHINFYLFKMFAECRKTPFKPIIVILKVFTLDKVL